MAYIDPSSTSDLMRILAPIFILVSVMGLQFKHRLKAIINRILNRHDNK